MKKIIIIGLIAVMLTSFVGCDEQRNSNNTSNGIEVETIEIETITVEVIEVE